MRLTMATNEMIASEVVHHSGQLDIGFQYIAATSIDVRR